MELELFETRTMLEALNQMLPPSSFLKRTFFSRERTFETEHVDIDIRKGKRRLAPYVNPMAEGKKVDRIGFKTFTYTPPYVKPKMTTDAQDFLKREMGNTIYSGPQSPSARAAEKLGEDLAEMDQMITRLEEKQASELLVSGKVTIEGEGISDVIDFQMPLTHQVTLAGPALWTDPSSKPLENLRIWKRLVRKNSGKVPTDLIMGEEALDAFLDNPNVKEVLDIRNFNLGDIDPEQLPEGAILYGRIKDVNINLWSYDEYYEDTTGTEVAMIDPKKVLLGTRTARTSTNYGAIQDLKATAAVARFPKSWETEDPSARWVMVQSAPLLSLNQSDAFFSAKVVS